MDPTKTPADALAHHPLVADLAARADRRVTESGGRRLTWHLWGEGPRVMLLHGSHGGWMHWLRNIAGLSRDFRLIVPDLPGFGESDPPEDLHSPADHARLLAEGLAALDEGNGPVAVVGFSLGALLGCYLSLVEPRVSRLVLVDAGGLDTPLRAADVRSPKGIEGEALHELNRHNLAAMMLHDPAAIDAQAIELNMAYGALARTRVQFHVVPDKLLPVLRQVRVPVDLIWGEHDFPHPDPELNAEVVRTLFPDARLRVVADAGHWAMYEQPERFDAALRDLLAPR